jgi:glycine cleavage system regulatory protein
MMKSALVMTLIGEDRPGLVESVASIVMAHEGNWMESRMCRLGGQFAGILRFEVPTDREVDVIQKLVGLQGSSGLSVTVQREKNRLADSGQRRVTLELVGNDRPGIINQISRTLAENGVNVESLETGTESAAMAGGTLFKANALLLLPEGCDLPKVQAGLEKIASDMMVDLRLAEANDS